MISLLRCMSPEVARLGLSATSAFAPLFGAWRTWVHALAKLGNQMLLHFTES
jgi:hypothetical protein